MRRYILTLLVSTMLASPAFARSADMDCTVTKVVDRTPRVTSEEFWKMAHEIATPEYRRITTFDSGEKGMITYGLGEGKPQNWTLPIIKIGKDGDKAPGIEAKTEQPDQFGYRRWIYYDFVGTTFPKPVIFWTQIEFPDHTFSGATGTCHLTQETIDKLMADVKAQKPSQELRDPATQPKVVNKTWSVPFEKNDYGTMALGGQLNGKVDVTWMLDTGASLTSIPYDLAKRLDASVIREQNLLLADGSSVTQQVILVKTISVGNVVNLDNVEVVVSTTGAPPLLGKNFLDKFSSYEINNRLSQLILRK
jgi:clan AA aspartic protease (TIGR02281 family)